MTDESQIVPMVSKSQKSSGRRTNKGASVSRKLYSPAILFAFAAFGGMLFIWYAKSSGYSNIVTTGVPVTIMFSYAMLLWIIPAFRLHAEQASDNFYYMGFLFTLTSLGAALYQFNDAQQVADIVRNFGIAIATTIVGIALRILWIQMRRDPVDIESESRSHLASASQQLTAELSSAAREFSQFRSANLQMIQEGFAEVDGLAKIAANDTKKALDALVAEAKIPLEMLTQDLRETLIQTSSTFQEQTNDKREFLEQSNAELSDGVKELRKHLKSLERALSNFKTPSAAVKIEMEDALSSFGKMIEGHDQRSQLLVEGIKENSKDLKTLVLELKIAPEKMTAAATSLQASLSELAALAKSNMNRQGELNLGAAAPPQHRALPEQSLSADDSPIVSPEPTPRRWFSSNR